MKGKAFLCAVAGLLGAMAILVIAPGKVLAGPKLLVVGIDEERLIQLWPHWERVDAMSYSDFITKTVSDLQLYDVIQLGHLDPNSNISSDAGKALVLALLQAGKSIYSTSLFNNPNISFAPGSVSPSFEDAGDEVGAIADPAHPIITIPDPDITVNDLAPINYGLHGSFTNVSSNYTVIATSGTTGNPVFLASSAFGPGRIFLGSHHFHGYGNLGSVRWVDSVVKWLLGADQPTLDIVSVTPSGSNLLAQINIADLNGDPLSGVVEILQDKGAPDSVTLETLNTCGKDLIELQLNGTPIGSLETDHVGDCTCGFTDVDSIKFSGPQIAANWNPGGTNTFTAIKTITDPALPTALAWVKAILTYEDSTTQEVCVFDQPGGLNEGCNEQDFCPADVPNYTFGPVSSSADVPPVVSESYTNSTLPPFLNVSSLPPGPYILHATATDGSTGVIEDFEPFNHGNEQFLSINDQPPHAICRNVTVNTAPATCSASASVNNGSFDPNSDPITLVQTPSGPYKPGLTNVTLTATDSHGASDSCTAILTVVDAEPPAVSCVQSVNASGNNVPQARKVNEDGFYKVEASDACTMPVIKIGNYTLANGETIKITQAPGKSGVTLVNTMGPLRIKHFQVGPGDAVITARDASGNSSSVTCLVPPPPK